PGESADDLPLFRTGILRLVDQNVIDALIELVMNPGGSTFAEKHHGLVDQVLIVEEPAAILARLITRDHGIGDNKERRCAVAAEHGLAPLEQRYEAHAFGIKCLGEFRIASFEQSGDQALPAAELCGEEDLQIAVCALPPCPVERGMEPVCLLLIAPGALPELVGKPAP